MAIAVKQNALLVTEDKDFGEMVFRFGMKHCGILLIRLIEMPIDQKQKLTLNALEQHGEELQNSFAVIDESNLRIRK